MISQAEERQQTGTGTFREPVTTAAANWRQIAAFLVLSGALLVLVPLARQTPWGAALRGPAWRENLSLFALLLVVTVGGILVLWCRLRLSDLGLRCDKFGQGISVVVIFWGVLQAWPFIASGSGELAATWNDPGVLVTLRWTAVMFLATGLWEEIAFRGFLLPQIYLRLPGEPPCAGQRCAAPFAIHFRNLTCSVPYSDQQPGGWRGGSNDPSSRPRRAYTIVVLSNATINTCMGVVQKIMQALPPSEALNASANSLQIGNPSTSDG
jgi:membrane protease YdiL (CAAX protease family)